VEGSPAELERGDGERATAFGGVSRGGTTGGAWRARRAPGIAGVGKTGAIEGGFGRGSARGRPVAALAANAVTASKQRAR